jgi:hypothetical protein
MEEFYQKLNSLRTTADYNQQLPDSDLDYSAYSYFWFFLGRHKPLEMKFTLDEPDFQNHIEDSMPLDFNVFAEPPIISTLPQGADSPMQALMLEWNGVDVDDSREMNTSTIRHLEVPLAEESRDISIEIGKSFI